MPLLWTAKDIHDKNRPLQDKSLDQHKIFEENLAHLQSSVFKLSKDLIDSIHEEGIVAYTS